MILALVGNVRHKIINIINKDNLVLFILVLAGSISCLTLRHFGLGAVYASALTGIACSLLKSRDYQAYGYTGSFMAMTDMTLSTQLLFIFCTVLLASLGTRLLERTFIGVGGKLGTIAFIASLTLVTIMGGLL